MNSSKDFKSCEKFQNLQNVSSLTKRFKYYKTFPNLRNVSKRTKYFRAYKKFQILQQKHLKLAKHFKIEITSKLKITYFYSVHIIPNKYRINTSPQSFHLGKPLLLKPPVVAKREYT